RPYLFPSVVATVRPGREEKSIVARQRIVIAVLIARIRSRDGLVALSGGDLNRRVPTDSVVERRLVPDVCFFAAAVIYRVIVDHTDCAGRLINCKPLVELIVQARLIVDDCWRRPRRPAIARARKPDARLASGRDIRTGFVPCAGAPRSATKVRPRGIDHILGRRLIRATRYVDQCTATVE